MAPTASPVESLRALGVAEDTYGPTVNTVRPSDVDTLGHALARLLGTFQVTALVLWNTVDDAVLAHSTAHHLGTEVRRASEWEGILSLSHSLDPGTRTALIGTRWTRRRLDTLRSLVTLSEAEPVVAAAILHSPALDEIDLPTAVLLSPQDSREFAP